MSAARETSTLFGLVQRASAFIVIGKPHRVWFYASFFNRPPRIEQKEEENRSRSVHRLVFSAVPTQREEGIDIGVQSTVLQADGWSTTQWQRFPYRYVPFGVSDSLEKPSIFVPEISAFEYGKSERKSVSRPSFSPFLAQHAIGL